MFFCFQVARQSDSWGNLARPRIMLHLLAAVLIGGCWLRVSWPGPVSQLTTALLTSGGNCRPTAEISGNIITSSSLHHSHHHPHSSSFERKPSVRCLMRKYVMYETNNNTACSLRGPAIWERKREVEGDRHSYLFQARSEKWWVINNRW